MKRYKLTIDLIHDLNGENTPREEINEKISVYEMKIADITIDKLLSLKYEKINFDDEFPIEIYILNNKKYIFFKPRFNFPPPMPRFKRPEEPRFEPHPKPFDLLLIDEFNENNFKYFWLIILITIDILLIWFFIFIRKKLNPLIDLKENMIKLSKGELIVSSKIKGKDEISQVSNEFDNAIRQLRQLRESRNLFLRNIMHELKTPITKGKLISDTLEEDERREILIRVFQRLEYLLSEFSKIEELTSGKLNLLKSDFRIVDLIDQALDILLLDDNYIGIKYNANPIINVDFDFFSIVLKNLIDNAIKYNTNGNPQIFIEKNYIKIVNKGSALSKDINEYYKPFNNDYETAQSGLGLGLYISNNIIKLHKFDLEYEYKDSYHNFVIKFN
jgi:two-component system, OmpR family, sensor kinase